MLLLTGCATTSTTETFSTQRMAYSALPVALAVAGAPGVNLTGRILAGEPQAQAQGGAVGFPSVQPELGALMQIGERTWVGGRANFVTGLAMLVDHLVGELPAYRRWLNEALRRGAAHCPFDEHAVDHQPPVPAEMFAPDFAWSEATVAEALRRCRDVDPANRYLVSR